MKTKLLYLIFITMVISFSSNAQLESKTFQTTVENIGKINLRFEGNVYELSTSAKVVVVKGNYEIKHKILTFTDTEGPMACPKDVTGKYEFEYNDGNLKLKAIQDACSGRNAMATTVWKEIKTN